MAEKDYSNCGKKQNQKLKTYLVMQYLLRNSDENHAVPASQIVGYLQEEGIDAERRAIYEDIKAVNKVMLMVEQDLSMDEAESEIEEYGDDARYIVYDPNKKGFYVKERRYEPDEIKLAAEAIYATKFLTEKQAKSFVDLLCGFVSDHQAQEIRHDVEMVDRRKTENKHTFQNVSTINGAMLKEVAGERREPSKISFKYQKYTINDVKKQVDCRKGAKYTVSPYKLLMNDGNYYLLAFDDASKEMRTYRVDRMKEVEILDSEPREGADVYAALNMRDFAKRTFSMFGGRHERVTIRFINPLLDAVIERFGTAGGTDYTKDDDDHFLVWTDVEISDQFFGWLLGFGKRTKIIAPQSVVDDFAAYLDKIRKMYCPNAACPLSFPKDTQGLNAHE